MVTGECLPRLVEGGEEGCRDHRGDADGAGLAALGAMRCVAHAFDLREGRLGLRQYRPASFSQLDQVRLAQKQLNAEVLLHLLNALRQRWLPHVQAFGGAAEMQLLRHRHETTQLAQADRIRAHRRDPMWRYWLRPTSLSIVAQLLVRGMVTHRTLNARPSADHFQPVRLSTYPEVERASTASMWWAVMMARCAGYESAALPSLALAIGRVEDGAHVGDVVHRLGGARRDHIAQAMRRVRIAFQHFQKQLAWNAHDGGRLQGG